MVALSTAKRKLKRQLDKDKRLVEEDAYAILFNQDPTFDPFSANFWIRNESDEKALCEGYSPDVRAGLSWASFYPINFTHTRGRDRGKPFFLLPWQRDNLLLPMMAWRNPRGYNRVRKADFFGPKKIGKTTFCSGLIAGFQRFGPPNIECYSTAYTKGQAKKLYRDTTISIKKSATLKDFFKFQDNDGRFTSPSRDSFFQVLAGEAGAKATEGVDATLAIMDEIHLMRDRVLYDFLELSGLARDWFLFFSISTVGKIDPTAIWTERYNYAKSWMKSETIDLAYFGMVYEADPIVATCPKARRDPEQLRRANPSIIDEDGRGIIHVDNLIQEIKESENNPGKLLNIIHKIFNVAVAKTSTKCIPLDDWDACEIDHEEMDDLWEYLQQGETYLEGAEVKTRKRRCYGGLDMASQEDLAAFFLFFPFTDAEIEDLVPQETLDLLQPTFEEDEDFDEEDHDDEDELPIPPGFLIGFVFCPKSKVEEREKKNEAFYRIWVESGDLIATRGKRIKIRQIKKKIKWVNRHFNLLELGYDFWGSEALIQELEDETDIELVEIKQDHKNMHLGVQSLITLVVEQAILHDGNQCVRWTANNAATSTKNDSVKFEKEESADKIDPMQASAMAIGRAVLGKDSFENDDGYFDDNGKLKDGAYL